MRPWLNHHLLEDSAGRFPDKPCLEEPGRTLSYAETVEGARRAAAAFIEAGLAPGAAAGIYMDKTIDQVLAMFGAWMAGGVVVLLNPILAEDQVLHIVKDCGIRTLAASRDTLTPDGRGRERIAPERWAEAGITGAVVFGGGKDSGFPSLRSGTGLKRMCRPEDMPAAAAEPKRITDDVSHIIYTSGSTGLPKGIVVTHRNSIDGAKIVSAYTGLSGDDRILGLLPLNFDYGFNQLMDAVLLGGTLVLHQFFMPNDLLRTLESRAITVFAGMPPVWLKIFNPRLCDTSKPHDFSRLRVITNSGGKVPVPVVRKLRGLFPSARIFLMYGLTEAFRSTYLDPDEIDRRPDSIGKAIPGVEVFVVDGQGRECGPGEEGELVHRGALITRGYWNNPQKTAEVFRPNPLLDPANRHLETVVFSGDVVKRDAEGFLYYVGRRDAMIKTKGYRVSPTEVEERVTAIPGVAECVAAAYEEEDEIKLRVFITLSSPAATAQTVTAHCKRHFPFYLVPDDVVVLSAFPLTANGKIDRNRTVQEHSDAKRKS
ncbi:MAG: AMP-binding protein [bacterium]|nr:AMP-binding protein [bacterium]